MEKRIIYGTGVDPFQTLPEIFHQNYLKRKASGAQKRYEDKIKERKKAEIEDKKAAIRAEDIAKGVFVPVSSLPQREPMKGVQSA